MFYLNGFESCIKTIFLLACSTEQKTINSIQELKKYYICFLNKYFSETPIPIHANLDKFCFDIERIKKISVKYQDDGILTDLKTKIDLNTPLASMEEALSYVNKGQILLNQVNPSLGTIFDLVIHTLFYVRSPNSGGGTISDAPGFIWCAIKRNWTDMDIAEFLVHELTHNLVFLDELCYQHYTDMVQLGDKKHYAKSSILNKERPLDKAFHSLVVAHEVLRYRQEAGEPNNPHVHPPSEQMLSASLATIKSIKSVIDNTDLVQPRFCELLAKVEASFSQLEKSLKTVVAV
ncbi:HEXXH motif-containing putative peptide modification protein [Oscillatoria sp. HE19RPO]|uniref:aKG-HExxH-type peptide beta-hydroxylase n=1 Tax=Oscillatoria sp. HE19RPO TaxID=2954806 RepID=UPI0020C20D08|nr:HEXXH motif-containing putative peptide modification protein [Oscillatoria sp. HE19RPO]